MTSRKPGSSGHLFVCGTPIGHLQDSSPRLIETLASCDRIAAEDTRVTEGLLRKFEIKKPIVSLQKFNEARRVEQIAAWLDAGEQIALVSDAGTPNICDPGALLIQDLIQRGYSVGVIPGPSALTALISVSGILASSFTMVGFFPRKKSEAQPLLDFCAAENQPCFFFESASRLVETLTWILSRYQIPSICIGKELTKVFETLVYGNGETILKQLEEIPLKGEWSVFLSLGPLKTRDTLPETVQELIRLRLTVKQVEHVCHHLLGFPKNRVYALFHSLKEKS